MTPALVLTPEARGDFVEAHEWYETQRPGWGEVFERSVEACLARIRRTPRAFAVVRGEVRRAQLRRFPHSVFYSIEDKQIVVVAIWHGHRDPRGWRERL